MQVFRATQQTQSKAWALLLSCLGEMSHSRDLAHGLSRPNGQKEMPNHEEIQSTGKAQLLQTEQWGDKE